MGLGVRVVARVYTAVSATSPSTYAMSYYVGWLEGSAATKPKMYYALYMTDKTVSTA